MRGRFQFVLLVVLSVFCSFSSFLRGDILHVPGDFSTIQGAIDASVDGDEIVVEAGTYHEAINFEGKAINLHSASGRDSTTIDATDLNASVVTCSSGEGAKTILDGFTITGGLGTEVGGRFEGGGMYNLNSSPTVINCTFSDMVRSSRGAGIFNEISSPAVENCMFLRNQANNGGGMANILNSNPTVIGCTFNDNEAGFGGGMYNQSSSPTIRDCVFSRTHGPLQTYGGGLANFLYSSPIISDCEFSDNIALKGGGIYNSNSFPMITRCSFTGNQSGNNGAGMYIDDSSPIVTDCSFEGNVADGNSGDNNGGGVYIKSSSPQFTNCTFNNNHSADNGGGIYIELQSSMVLDHCTFTQNSIDRIGGGAIFLTWDSFATISASTFTEHTGAGAVYITKDSSLELKSDVFERNSTDGEGGGAIYHDGNDLSISGCQFIGNEGTKGGAIMLVFGSNPTMTVTNTRFTGNIATDSGGALDCESRSVENITNCIFDDNSASRGGAISSFHNDMQLVNSTLIGNSAENGGALFNDFSTTDPVIANCIFDDNTATTDGNHIFNNSGAEPRIAYSNIESSGGSGGNWDSALGVDLGGNIDFNPMFVSSGDGDFELRSGSPCIDAGANDAVPIDIEFDFNFHPRFVDDPFITDTGFGDPPIVDMGAFEFQAEVGPTLVVSPNPLVAGADAEFTLTNARADSESFLIYSLSGLGSVFIGGLNVTLDLDNPMRVNGSKFTDGDGVAHYVRHISEKGKGRNIWFQGVEQNLKTEVVATKIR